MKTTINGDSPTSRSLVDIFRFVGLAFAISWGAWILVIRFHGPEAFLNFGSAGPALAALILSRRPGADSQGGVWMRLLAFGLIVTVCWIVLSGYYSWRSSPNLSLDLDPWLLVPAAVPAWICSRAFSRNCGVRSLVRRLVHRPDYWSGIGFLVFAVILIIPAYLARLAHQPLVMPEPRRSLARSIVFACIFFLYNFLFVATHEEPGWRGFLLDRLQQRFSPLLASFFVWIPLTIWHAPLDYTRPVPFSLVMYLEIRVIFAIPVVIILTWLYNRSGRSIQAGAMFHASMNTLPFLLPYFMPGFVLLFPVAAYAAVADQMWRARKAHDLVAAAA